MHDMEIFGFNCFANSNMIESLYSYKGGYKVKLMPTFVFTLIVLGFLITAMPEDAYSGFEMASGGCCQFMGDRNDFFCEETPGTGCLLVVGGPEFFGFFDGQSCNEATGLCGGFVPEPISTNVPALSEWGLIATAGVLGILGFLGIRRRKSAA